MPLDTVCSMMNTYFAKGDSNAEDIMRRKYPTAVDIALEKRLIKRVTVDNQIKLIRTDKGKAYIEKGCKE